MLQKSLIMASASTCHRSFSTSSSDKAAASSKDENIFASADYFKDVKPDEILSTEDGVEQVTKAASSVNSD